MLAQGAGLFGFGVAAPRFTGHELCTAVPWVQGPSDPAPLHPNAAGELAIALADQQAFPLLSPPPVVLPSPVTVADDDPRTRLTGNDRHSRPSERKTPVRMRVRHGRADAIMRKHLGVPRAKAHSILSSEPDRAISRDPDKASMKSIAEVRRK